MENGRCLRLLPCAPLGHRIRKPVGCRRRSRRPVRLPAGYPVRHLPLGAAGRILQAHRSSDAKRSLKLVRKTDYILVTGLMSLVCSVVEKAVPGNPEALAVSLAIPMHITWQFNQGGHWFEYEKARAANDRPWMRREMIMAIAVPFIFHGCWDSGLDLVIWLMEKDATAAQVVSGVLVLAMLTLGILYTIRTIKKVRGIARAAL